MMQPTATSAVAVAPHAPPGSTTAGEALPSASAVPNPSSSDAPEQPKTDSLSTGASPVKEAPSTQESDADAESNVGHPQATSTSTVAPVPTPVEEVSQKGKELAAMPDTSSTSVVSAEAAPAVEEAPKQKDPKRCFSCSKKVGLLGFSCRCGYVFCENHRHANTHDCTFDYMSYDRDQLRMNNQKIVAEKIQKI